MDKNNTSHEGHEIVTEEKGDNNHLYINGHHVHTKENNGKYWSRHTPYIHYSSLNELAKSLIAQSEVIRQSNSKKQKMS